MAIIRVPSVCIDGLFRSILSTKYDNTVKTLRTIWFKIFIKKKSFVCIEDIKFAIISEFFSPLIELVHSGGFSHFICLRGIL